MMKIKDYIIEALLKFFFGKLKNHNRILVRRDTLINTYLGFVYLGCIYIL